MKACAPQHGTGTLLAALLAAAVVTGCGKKAPLEPPPGEVSTYPREYPAPGIYSPPAAPPVEKEERYEIFPSPDEEDSFAPDDSGS